MSQKSLIIKLKYQMSPQLNDVNPEYTQTIRSGGHNPYQKCVCGWCTSILKYPNHCPKCGQLRHKKIFIHEIQ